MRDHSATLLIVFSLLNALYLKRAQLKKERHRAELLAPYLSDPKAPMDGGEKAWAELDSVVGRDRLPEFSDREALPYVGAIARELVRWHVVAPTGLAHQNIQDDEYKGYMIPRGTVLVPNLW